MRREGSPACARGRRSARSSPTSGAAAAPHPAGADHREVALPGQLSPQVRVRPRPNATPVRRDHEWQWRRRPFRAVLRGCHHDGPPGHAVVGSVADPPLPDPVTHAATNESRGQARTGDPRAPAETGLLLDLPDPEPVGGGVTPKRALDGVQPAALLGDRRRHGEVRARDAPEDATARQLGRERDLGDDVEPVLHDVERLAVEQDAVAVRDALAAGERDRPRRRPSRSP